MSFLRYLPVAQMVVVLVAAITAALLGAAPGIAAHDHPRAIASAARVLLCGSVVAILALTLLPSNLSPGVNLVPLRGIATQLSNINGPLGAINIAGNVAMFVPAGLLAAMSLGWGVRRISVVALALSVTIEMVQLALGRSADIDDVILNTAGAAVGALLCMGIAVLMQQRSLRRITIQDPPRTTTGT